jgi:hypothetical protein
MKFPSLLHVTVDGEGEDQYLSAHEDGVSGLDVHGQPVAIYKLTSVGQVEIQKAYVGKPPRQGRRRAS